MPASFLQQFYEPLVRQQIEHGYAFIAWADNQDGQRRRQADPAFDAVWSACERRPLDGVRLPYRVMNLLNAGKQRRAELALFRATGLTYEQADLIGDRYLYGRDGYQERW